MRTVGYTGYDSMTIDQLIKKYENSIFKEYDFELNHFVDFRHFICKHKDNKFVDLNKKDLIRCVRDLTLCFDTLYDDSFKFALHKYSNESLLAIIIMSVYLREPVYMYINHKYTYEQIIRIGVAIDNKVPLNLINSPYISSKDMGSIIYAFSEDINIATLNAFHVSYKDYRIITDWANGDVSTAAILPILEEYNMMDMTSNNLFNSDPSDK